MTYTTPQDFERRARERLLPADAVVEAAGRSDFDLTPDTGAAGWRRPGAGGAAPRRAAVLMGLKPAGDDYAVLFTLRPQTMREHAGQVAFPGGRVDQADGHPLAAALREAREEVGLQASEARILGQADPYLTSTGYLVSVFLGLLPADFTPKPEPGEVADVFFTPLSFLMRPENHLRHARDYAGASRAYYAMPHDGRYIWGATAGMIKSVYDRLYGRDAATTREGRPAP